MTFNPYLVNGIEFRPFDHQPSANVILKGQRMRISLSLFTYFPLILVSCLPADPARSPAPVAAGTPIANPAVVNKNSSQELVVDTATTLCVGQPDKVTKERCEWYASTAECSELPIQKQICARMAANAKYDRPQEIVCKVRPVMGLILRSTPEKSPVIADSNKLGDVRPPDGVRVLWQDIVPGYGLVRAKGSNGVEVSAYVCNTCDPAADMPYLTCPKS